MPMQSGAANADAANANAARCCGMGEKTMILQFSADADESGGAANEMKRGGGSKKCDGWVIGQRSGIA